MDLFLLFQSILFKLFIIVERYIHCMFRATYTLALFGHDAQQSISGVDIVLTIFLVLLGFFLKIYLTAQVLM